jgi:CheY-like chemotaxis protein
MQQRVLVVDDDQLNRILLEAILRDAGFAVDLAAGGTEAIDKLKKEDFAAILLDMLMPAVDGFDVIQFLIRTNPATLERVIVVSALDDRFVANFDPTLVYAFVKKPFDRHDLVEIVRRCVTRRDPDETAH